MQCPHTLLQPGHGQDQSADACWYCNQIEPADELCFSTEWDTRVHPCCIVRARHEDPHDIEAKVFAQEFGLMQAKLVETA